MIEMMRTLESAKAPRRPGASYYTGSRAARAVCWAALRPDAPATRICRYNKRRPLQANPGGGPGRRAASAAYSFSRQAPAPPADPSDSPAAGGARGRAQRWPRGPAGAGRPCGASSFQRQPCPVDGAGDSDGGGRWAGRWARRMVAGGARGQRGRPVYRPGWTAPAHTAAHSDRAGRMRHARTR